MSRRKRTRKARMLERRRRRDDALERDFAQQRQDIEFERALAARLARAGSPADVPTDVLGGAAIGAFLIDLLHPSARGGAFARGLMARHVAEVMREKLEKPGPDRPPVRLRVIQGGKE